MTSSSDLTGRKFGKLTVAALGNKGSRLLKCGTRVYYSYWMCDCDCGAKHVASSQALLSGRTKSCGCSRKDNISKFGNEKRHKIGSASLNAVYNGYKRQARRRGISFNIGKEAFEEITSRNCFYCGSKPNQNIKRRTQAYYGDYIYNGIDRVDNSRGYEDGNIVSCCRKCNFSKRTQSIDEFRQWVLDVYSTFAIRKEEF
jgi:hypothetical protein